MSPDSKPSPRVDERSRVARYCPGTRNEIVPAPLDRVAGLLHEPQKCVKAVRAFGKGIAADRLQPFLVGGLALRL